MDTTPRPVALAHDLVGSGPLLVLIHGITEDRRSWDPLTDDLARDHTVLRIDLRGHGESPTAEAYDLASMAVDLATVIGDLDTTSPPLLVGHSLGGTVAAAYAAAFPTRGVVDVDQSLDLAAFQAQVRQIEPMLRSEGHHLAISAVFEAMRGPLPDAEVARIEGLRAPRQDVVLGVWAPLLELSTDELDAMVTQVAAAISVPFLALHGIDPGPGYDTWLRERIPTAAVEVWDDHGHYPHLVDPSRFLDRLRTFEASLPSADGQNV